MGTKNRWFWVRNIKEIMLICIGNPNVHLSWNVAFRNLRPLKAWCMVTRNPPFHHAIRIPNVLNRIPTRSELCIIYQKWRGVFRFNAFINWQINQQRICKFNLINTMIRSRRKTHSWPDLTAPGSCQQNPNPWIYGPNVAIRRWARGNLTYMWWRRRSEP